jgi:hypothetical protein
VECEGARGKRKLGSYRVHGNAQRESICLVEEAKAYAKAVRSDDVPVPEHLWNDHVKALGIAKEMRDKALAGFQNLGLRWFKSALKRDCADFVARAHGVDWTSKPRKGRNGDLTELSQDQHAIANLVWYSTHTNWFEFNAGSQLVFFRFPQQYWREARDGVRTFFEQPRPTTRRAQPIIQDPVICSKTRDKIEKVLKRRYLVPTDLVIKSNIKFFPVPKGEDDIRIVYDATANKLNEAVWVPTFWLPAIDSLARAVGSDSWMTDKDIGDMFLNFQLHQDIKPFTGVDLTCLYDGPGDPGPQVAVWDRNLMGYAALPQNSIKMALVAKEVCKGNRCELGVWCDGKELNPFQWRRIGLNLPGTKDCNPCVSWITKRREDGRIACDILTFVDDERVVGPSKELTWQASHVLASKQSYLGIQDAPRKARPCSQTTGA